MNDDTNALRARVASLREQLRQALAALAAAEGPKKGDTYIDRMMTARRRRNRASGFADGWNR